MKRSINIIKMKNAAVPISTPFTANVFARLAAGLLTSGFVAFKLFQNYRFAQSVIDNDMVFVALVPGHLGFVIWISVTMKKMAAPRITPLFIVFSIINGLLFPLIFQFFTQHFMISTFYILAGMFFLMSAFGYVTQRDLTSWGNLVLMAVIGMCLNVWLNTIWTHDSFQLITSGIAVIVFTGIVAFDSKRIKELKTQAGSKESTKAAVMGAFSLYLDVYYLFLVIVLAVNKREKKSSS